MNEGRKISICIPSYNRCEMTLDSFKEVYEDERISEVVIVDDASDINIFNQLKEVCDALPKVKLIRNITNQDCYRNKATSLGYAINEYAILLDSDNTIDTCYIDKIYEQEWSADVILTPSYAKPNFDFRAYEGITISKENISYLVGKPMVEVCLNAANYFVNVNSYLEVWDGNEDPVTSDSIYQCLNWLKSGRKIKIVQGLEYLHRVHSGSHWQNNIHRTKQGFHQSILNKLKEMK